MSLILPRRKLLVAGVAAPALLRSHFAKAFAMPRGSASIISADPIASVLAGMVSGQWKQLTGASQGGFNAAQQALTLANWDYGVGNGGSATTWATTPGLPSSGDHGVFAFSTSAIRTDGEVNHWGGGHTDGGDNSVMRFSAKAACQAILGAGGSQNWSLLVPGGFYLPMAAIQPAGSDQGLSAHSALQTTGTYGSGASSIVVASITTADSTQAAAGWTVGGADIPGLVTIASITGTGPYTVNLSGGVTSGAGTNKAIGFSLSAYWATANKNGNLRTIAAHAYWTCLALGLTGYWTVTGSFGWSPIGDTTPGVQQEIIKDDGTTAFTTNLPNVANYTGYSMGGSPVWCDLDGKVYCWQSADNDSTKNHLFRVANPTTTTPTTTDLGSIGAGTENFTGNAPVVIRYPDSSHRAIFNFRPAVSATTFELATDITGSPAGNAYTFGSIPSPVGVAHGGFCSDTSRSTIRYFDGSGQLGSITIAGSPGSSTWTQESSGAVSGDLPNVASGQFCRIEYLPVQDAYVAAAAGDVWLRKP